MNKQFERIKLRVLATLSIISLVLCVIAVILWPLSYASGVQYSLRNGKGVRCALVTTPGQVGVIVVRGEPRGDVSPFKMRTKSFTADTSTAADPLRWFWTRPAGRFFGTSEGSAVIHYEEVQNSMPVSYVGRFMPIWILAIVTFIAPAWWYLARRRRDYRLENGLCMFCGADMSASPYRCPACGKEPPW